MLILKSPWTRQPQGPVGINWSNPLTQGLVFAFDGNIDQVNDRLADITNTAGYGVGEKGQHRVFTNNGSLQLSWRSRRPPTQYATLVSLAYCTSSTTTSTICALPSESTSNVRVLLDISGTETNDPVRVILQNGASIGIVYLTQPSGEYLNKWVLFGGASISGTDNRIYINGARKTPTSTAGTSGISLGAVTRFDVGITNNMTPESPFSGNIAFSAVWNRLLSDSEHARLAENPWQIFPRRIPIPTSTAAASYTHPTLSAATALEIGATSFKPSVTYTFA